MTVFFLVVLVIDKKCCKLGPGPHLLKDNCDSKDTMALLIVILWVLFLSNYTQLIILIIYQSVSVSDTVVTLKRNEALPKS